MWHDPPEFLQSVAFTQVHLSFLINVNCVIKKPLLSLFVANNSMYKMNTQQEKKIVKCPKIKTTFQSIHIQKQ